MPARLQLNKHRGDHIKIIKYYISKGGPHEKNKIYISKGGPHENNNIYISKGGPHENK